MKKIIKEYRSETNDYGDIIFGGGSYHDVEIEVDDPPQKTLKQLIEEQKRIDENNRRISNYNKAMYDQEELKVNARIKDEEKSIFEERVKYCMKNNLPYEHLIEDYIRNEEMKDFYTTRKQNK